MKLSLSEKIGSAAIQASLEDDSLLQRRIAELCRTCFGRAPKEQKFQLPELFEGNANAAGVEETIDHWAHRGRSSALWKLMQPVVTTGAQPVFAAVSLMVRSTDPTVLLPVPFLCTRNVRDFRRYFWINADKRDQETFRPSRAELAGAVRDISHALSNISYSVRIDDEPSVGWLAAAHKSSNALYFPNVEEARPPVGETYSAATREEPHLGMASLLYIPLLKPSRETGHSRAVLLLWSPVPRRWDRCFYDCTPDPAAPAAIKIGDFEQGVLRNRICRHFHWLEHVIARDDSAQHRFELQIHNLVLKIRSWQDRQNALVKDAVDELLHRVGPLLKYIVDEEHDDSTAVAKWFEDWLFGNSGFLNVLRSRWMKDKRISKLNATSVRIKTLAGQQTFPCASAVSKDIIYESFPENIRVPFDSTVSAYIQVEAVDNISKYAEVLHSISIITSSRFVIVRLLESPKKRDLIRLQGSDSAFKRYYGIRRGLAVAPRGVEGQGAIGQGIGFWLYRVFAAKTKVFRQFYISPEGNVCHTDLVLPLKRGNEDGG